jgi:glutamate-1-semialdehyde 2,1-aminomutase
MIESNWQRGETLQRRLNEVIARHELASALQVTGYPCLFALICRNSQGQPDDAFRTLMMQEMITRGVLFQGLFYPTWSHQQAEIDYLVSAFDQSCAVYRRAVDAGSCGGLLIGPPAKPVFRKKI